jgi:cytochrome c553
MRLIAVCAVTALFGYAAPSWAEAPTAPAAANETASTQESSSEGFDASAADTAATPRGDLEAGRLKAYTCLGCHGIASYRNVYPHFHVPRIGGQNFEYLVAALRGYQSGERQHPTMQAQAESMSEQDIYDLARYFADSVRPGQEGGR